MCPPSAASARSGQRGFWSIGRWDFLLRAAGRTFESPLTDLRRQAAPGIPRNGVAAFQLPDVPDEAALLVSHAAADQWGNPLLAPLDTQIEVMIPLRGKDIHNELDLSRMNAQ